MAQNIEIITIRIRPRPGRLGRHRFCDADPRLPSENGAAGMDKSRSSRRKPRIAVVVVGPLTLAALLLAPTAAVPEGKIVIHGPGFSSHLRISVSGGNVLVNGQMADNPVGCAITEGHRAAVCPIAGAGGMEIVMGPADDKIQVEDPLPMPLLVRLGDGSDKFLGNDEPDTCYSEGSKRNRCHRRRRRRHLHHRPAEQRLRRRRRQRLLQARRRQRRLLGRARQRHLRNGPRHGRLPRRAGGRHAGRRARSRPALRRRRKRLLRRRPGRRTLPRLRVGAWRLGGWRRRMSLVRPPRRSGWGSASARARCSSSG